MKTVSWKEIKTDIDPRGLYTHQIKWIPPKSSGFIVQRVEVEDPAHLLSGYEKPYYEAWRVEDGTVLDSDGESVSESKYDDSFTNCHDGDWPENEIAIETAERQMKSLGIDHTNVAYYCRVYWVEGGSETAEEVNLWPPGEKIGIIMAGKLKASYVEPKGIGEGVDRDTFRAIFVV